MENKEDQNQDSNKETKVKQLSTNRDVSPKKSLFSSAKARTALRGRAEIEEPNPNSGTVANLAPIEGSVSFELISIATIDPNPFYSMGFNGDGNKRGEKLNEGREWLLEKLVELWREGQLTEFVALVRPHPTQPPRYQLVYGHLRLRAASLAGLNAIPAIVKPISDDEMLRRFVLENQNRATLSKVEIASQIQHLREQFGMSYKSLGELFNLPLSTVYDLYYLSLASQPFLEIIREQPQYYQAVSEMIRRKLPSTAQAQILNLLQTGKVSPRQVREKIRELLLVNQKT